jgi:hypothetical protein
MEAEQPHDDPCLRLVLAGITITRATRRILDGFLEDSWSCLQCKSIREEMMAG